MKCCVCKRTMRKLHFCGCKIVWPTFINDELDMGEIIFPQALCKKCYKSFDKWLFDRNIFINK